MRTSHGSSGPTAHAFAAAPADPAAPTQDRPVVAVDVGGTEIKAALVDIAEYENARPRILEHLRRRTPQREDGKDAGHDVVDSIVEIVHELRSRASLPVAALGLVIPGTVDERRGVGVFSSNLGWRDFPFRDVLTERLELPVAFGHDVRAGGLAEARLGAARDVEDVAVLPIGTGIAAALVLGGELHTGGGEIGHVDVGHGEPCQCGQHGCLEAVASSGAIARRYAERSGNAVAGAAEVAELVRQQDPTAEAVWSEAVDGLTRGLLILAALIAPSVVVLGGGLALAGDLLMEPLRAKLSESVTFHRLPELRRAELDDEAGVLGATLLAEGMVHPAGRPDSSLEER